MSWSIFQCQDPDFSVRSAPDNITFGVSRHAMQRSEVFRDMFSLCEQEPGNSPEAPDAEGPNVVDLHEPADVLAILLRILHEPPKPPEEIVSDPPELDSYVKKYNEATVIPLPLLELVLLHLVDKYLLDESITRVLEQHLLAHAASNGLRVYSFAVANGMSKVANKASHYVLPMAQYTLQDVRCIPTVKAYHDIVRLQDFRVQALRDLLLKEDIFPHGYGACQPHAESTPTTWDTRRKALLARIETGSDIAWEMSSLVETFRDCKTCQKACIAAVDMLAYKCRRIPKTLEKLPSGYLE
ncbi:hypothetical protein D9611_003181 [Ephemerocybe angulata]|uniref:BTB domain-containing protein n=1 Tax=Ephemerocybe angulata TaxID=980116 RepID=A0A8H5C836_9AGAR|nr:hypothetical protein D9611_003181 [Tulosesus angulatus]